MLVMSEVPAALEQVKLWGGPKALGKILEMKALDEKVGLVSVGWQQANTVADTTPRIGGVVLCRP